MSIRILSDPVADDGAAMYDSTSGWAFGPVFGDRDEAERFLEWMDANDHGDARSLSDKELERLYGEFVDQDEVAA